jgi:hypothetical protein
MSQAGANTNWKPLYRVSGAAASITAVLVMTIATALYFVAIGVFLSVISVSVLWIWYILFGRRLI